jgi:hypothetical protein
VLWTQALKCLSSRFCEAHFAHLFERVRVFKGGMQTCKWDLQMKKWRKVLLERGGKPFQVEVLLFGALASRTVIGCENTERQLL